MKIEAVVFDIGETLIDETRIWTAWADWLGVPRLTFLGVLGGVIERNEHDQAVFEFFQPGFDLDAAFAARRAAGDPAGFGVEDVYPDVAECFQRLHAAGLRLGVAGNQPSGAEAIIDELALPVEMIAASERWGIEKPSPAFFERIAGEFGLPPGAIAYVGDRVDNDVLPSIAAGMVSVFLRRGPWGYIHARRPDAQRAAIWVENLTELPNRIAAWNTSPS